MDIVAFVLNTVIGVVIVGGTIGFLMQQDPPTAAVVEGMPEELPPESGPSSSPGPCATSSSRCAGPSYGPPPTSR